MRISNNQKFIDRNKKISQIILYSALGLLVLGFVWSLKNTNVEQNLTAYYILIPAYLLVQVAISMANKWGRSPRPDEIIALSLKGLNNQYSLYNFNAGVPHLLVGPAGIWIINPYYHSGVISYNADKKRYVQKGGPNFFAKTFAQEGIPSIERECKNLLADYHDYVKSKKLDIAIEPQVVNFYYSEKVDLQVKDAPQLNIQADKFKDYLRQAAKKPLLSDEEIKRITDQLPKETA
ncbi:MAG: hypothetical protein HPY72_02960 [Anaerolineae bacterium]|jgi:hypothetical protein|nr:hypothetical protein [Anaerolineae bacterium]